MTYLDEFQKRIVRDDYQGFMSLWEEYCGLDEVSGDEFEQILEQIDRSRFAGRFGGQVETSAPLLERITDQDGRLGIVRLILDLQTTQSPQLASLAFESLESRYGQESLFQKKLQLVGLRNGHSFQGAIRNYELLTHLEAGRFVYHTGGWGTGEIMDISLVREELVLEFEEISGKRSLSFENAMATLIPLDDDHFYSRRFGDPDVLEEEARKDPVAVIKMLLRDLGGKTATELKQELCELVIPAEDWSKWWQTARNRSKKDTEIEPPSSIREPFRLRDKEVSHSSRLEEALVAENDPEELLSTIYSFLRDFPLILKEETAGQLVYEKLQSINDLETSTESQKLQASSLLEDHFPKEKGRLSKLVVESTNIRDAIESIKIIALKKKALAVVRKDRSDWVEIFLDVLFRSQQSILRDYLVKELQSDQSIEVLTKRLIKLLDLPIRQPSLFVWYFQKVVTTEGQLPLSDKVSIYLWVEAFLTLLHQLEHVPEQRDLVKKMHNLLNAQRYALVRSVLKDSSVDFAKEFLLLISKCHCLSGHDDKIMHSLVEVVHPNLVDEKSELKLEDMVFWATQEGYERTARKIERLATTEMAENAKEIEAARELGDLRENAGYKSAQEKRARLQAEIQMLSQQVNNVRILTASDISSEKVGVGNIVVLEDSEGQTVTYTLLGSWEANPEENILSYRSKKAQAMLGMGKEDSFEFQKNHYTIKSIDSYLNRVTGG